MKERRYEVLQAHDVIEIACCAVAWAYDVKPLEVIKKKPYDFTRLVSNSSINASFWYVVNYLEHLTGSLEIADLLKSINVSTSNYYIFKRKYRAIKNGESFSLKLSKIIEKVDQMVANKIKMKYHV